MNVLNTELWSGLIGAILGGSLALVGGLVAMWRSNLANYRLQKEHWEREESIAFRAAIEEIDVSLNKVTSLCIFGVPQNEREPYIRDLNHKLALAINRAQTGEIRRLLVHLWGMAQWALTRNRSDNEAMLDWLEVADVYAKVNLIVFGEQPYSLEEYLTAAQEGREPPNLPAQKPTNFIG